MEHSARTPLYSSHKQLNAKMVHFFGWEMPLQYSGILDEQKATRTNVTLFDVSHMGEFLFTGKDASENVQFLTTNEVENLSIGQAQYTCLLNEKGTFIDDCTVYKLAPDTYLMCVNASNTEKDFQHIKKHLFGEVNFENISSKWGQIAVQGRNSEKLLSEVLNEDLTNIAYYHFIQTKWNDQNILVARMGYTGEDGFEVFIPSEQTLSFWNELLEKGKKMEVKPAGLGARDLLRIEACFPLYGNDISEDRNPIEANLSWIVKFNKKNFIGKEALEKIKKEGTKQKLVRFSVEGQGIPRKDYELFTDNLDKKIGTVTSGTASPTSKKGIGMGYIDTEYSKIGSRAQLKIRDKFVPIRIQKENFI